MVKLCAPNQQSEWGFAAQLRMGLYQPICDGEVVDAGSQRKDEPAEIPTNAVFVELEGEVHLFEQPSSHVQKVGPPNQFLLGYPGAFRSLCPRQEGAYKNVVGRTPATWARHADCWVAARSRSSTTVVSAISSTVVEPVFHTASYSMGSSMSTLKWALMSRAR